MENENENATECVTVTETNTCSEHIDEKENKHRYTQDSLLEIRESPLSKNPPKCLDNPQCKYRNFWKRSQTQLNETDENKYKTTEPVKYFGQSKNFYDEPRNYENNMPHTSSGTYFASNNRTLIGSGRLSNRDFHWPNNRYSEPELNQRHVHFDQNSLRDRVENENGLDNHEHNLHNNYNYDRRTSFYRDIAYHDKYATNNIRGRQNNRYPNNYRNSNYNHYNQYNNNYREAEPEWMNCGPISQNDIIELRGFDEPMPCNTSDSTFTINDNTNSLESQDGHTTARSSTPTKKNDSNNNDKFHHEDIENKKAETVKKTSTNQHFNFEEFLKADPLTLLSNEEHQSKGSKSSRFSQWFNNENLHDQHKSHKLDTSRLIHDDLNNIINESAEFSNYIVNNSASSSNSNQFRKMVGGDSKKFLAANILRGEINPDRNFTNNKFQNVEDLEAQLLKTVLADNKNEGNKMHQNKEDIEKFKTLLSKISVNNWANLGHLTNQQKIPGHGMDISGNYLLQLLNKQQQHQQQQKIKQIISNLYVYQMYFQQQQALNGLNNNSEFLKVLYGQKIQQNNPINYNRGRPFQKQDISMQYAANIEYQQMQQQLNRNNNINQMRNNFVYEKDIVQQQKLVQNISKQMSKNNKKLQQFFQHKQQQQASNDMRSHTPVNHFDSNNAAQPIQTEIQNKDFGKQ